MRHLVTATQALADYLSVHDETGFAYDHARMLARDAALPISAYPSEDRRNKVLGGRIIDTYSVCEEFNLDSFSEFNALWDEIVYAAIGEGIEI